MNKKDQMRMTPAEWVKWYRENHKGVVDDEWIEEITGTENKDGSENKIPLPEIDI